MKRVVSFIVAVLVLVPIVLMLSSCGGNAQENALVGTWVDDSRFVEFKSDGTVHNVKGYGEYKIGENNDLIITWDGGSQQTFTYTDKKSASSHMFEWYMEGNVLYMYGQMYSRKR